MLSGMLESHEPISGFQDDMSFVFQEPADRHMVFNGGESRKQLQHQQHSIDAGAGMPLTTPLEKLVRLQDELRELVTRQAVVPGKQGLGEPSRRNPSLSSRGSEDDEAMQATLSLLTIIHELLQTSPGSGSGSPSSLEEHSGVHASQDPSYRGQGPTHEVIHVRDPAFDANSSAASQTAMLQVLNCYTYLLQLLDLTTCRLEEQMDPQRPPQLQQRRQTETAVRAPTTGGVSGRQRAATASVHIGSVSLDSFPALNAELVLCAILRIVKRIHGMIDLLAFGRTAQEGDDNGKTGYTHGEGFASPVIIAAQAVMGVVYEKEKALVARMTVLAGR